MLRLRLVASIALLMPVAGYAQHQHAAPAKGAPARPAMTDAQKIQNAMNAAPANIAKDATIMDWPASPTDQPRQLRAGTNNWLCFPSTPAGSGADPMCLDKQWQGWAQAFMTRTAPQFSGTGIAYMLQGDKGVSNTDPFATAPTADNDWVVAPPHIMLLFSDLTQLDAYPTDPKSGGPWVMWKGTPYAHLMVPVSTLKAAAMTKPAAKPAK